jgi:hypothetical protein
MSPSPPEIHVLDKADYSKHRLVTLPTESLPPIAPSSLRFRSKVLGLTTNNLTYARMGQFMGWYDIYPLPSNTPESYSDSATYGRISAWGYAEIIESTVPGITKGQSVYGYLPISTGTEDVRVEYATHQGKEIRDQIIVLDKHRQHLWKLYNRYQVCAPLEELENSKGIDSLGWDALMQGLFGTAYNLSTYGFAWDEGNRIHPSGKGDWTATDADLRNATVVILNASGKTGMSFAYNLRHARPKHHQPETIIGVASPVSLRTIGESGFFDKTVLNDDVETIASTISTQRVVLFDFGARPGANTSWSSALSALPDTSFSSITIGGEVAIQDPEKMRKRLADRATMNVVHSSLLREKGIEVDGEAYFTEFHTAWEGFKKSVGGGVELKWGEGLDDWADGWEGLVRDEVRAGTGLVYRV